MMVLKMPKWKKNEIYKQLDIVMQRPEIYEDNSKKKQTLKAIIAKKRATIGPGKIYQHLNTIEGAGTTNPQNEAQLESLPEWQQNEGFFAQIA